MSMTSYENLVIKKTSLPRQEMTHRGHHDRRGGHVHRDHRVLHDGHGHVRGCDRGHVHGICGDRGRDSRGDRDHVRDCDRAPQALQTPMIL